MCCYVERHPHEDAFREGSFDVDIKKAYPPC